VIFHKKRKYAAVAQEKKLLKAEAEVADLSARADRVSEKLTARLRRNHWGETIDAIIKNGVHNA
jgi:hypothetical protein